MLGNMTITKSRFRLLLTAWVVVEILDGVVSEASVSSLPAPLRDYVQAQSEANLTTGEIVASIIAILTLIAFVVSIIGLYLFWRPARPLTVITLVLALIYTVLAGPTVELGLATSLDELGAVLWGIILALIYLPPAKDWFERPHAV